MKMLDIIDDALLEETKSLLSENDALMPYDEFIKTLPLIDEDTDPSFLKSVDQISVVKDYLTSGCQSCIITK